MRIYLNGESKDLAESSTLLDLVNELHLPSTRIAIELNRTVVRRRDWESTNLNENDRLEIVHFVGGGAAETRVESRSNTCLR